MSHLLHVHHFQTVDLLVVLLLFMLVLSSESMDSSRISIIIKLEGSRGAGNDFYLIGGKNCDSPTLIKKGKKSSRHKRGKIIIIEKECEESYKHSMHGHAVPIYIPSYGHGHHHGY